VPQSPLHHANINPLKDLLLFLPPARSKRELLFFATHQNRHLDRSDSQSHRESRSGEILAFVFVVAVACPFICHPRRDLLLQLPAHHLTRRSLPESKSTPNPFHHNIVAFLQQMQKNRV
jgi:hypothetical protein